MSDKHLISVDELRAAGALDVPRGWRTSLNVERERSFNFMDDDENSPGSESESEEQEADETAPIGPDDEGE